MATPLITTQQQQPQGAYDPFANIQNPAIEDSKRQAQEYADKIAQAAAVNPNDPRIYDWQRAQQWHQTRMTGVNPDTGQPLDKGWANLIDPATGQLRENYQIAQYDPNEFEGYQQFKGEALRSAGTPSAWANIQQQRQAAEEAQAKDAAAKQAMSSQSQAMGALSMRGGMGSGSATSLARDMQRQLLNQRQAVGRQGMMSRFDIQSKDEEARQRNLGQLVGFEKDIAQGKKNIEKSNLDRLMQEIEGRRAFESDKYKSQMREWGAEKEAQAMGSGGGGK